MKIQFQLIFFFILFLFPKLYNAQCLTMTCPPSITVNAASNACAANVVYTQPTVNCLTCATNTQVFTYTGSMQNFVVPAGITAVTILAYGARGGTNTSSAIPPGNGAAMRGSFAVTPLSTLRVLVGESPSISTGNGNGGGGASYVTTSASVALIVAGGGGGSSATTNSTAKNGNTTTTGGNGAAGGGIGGSGGNGGGVGGTGFQSGAGGGFFTNGAVGWSAGSDGKSFMNGGAGGLVAAWAFARGGYGGGGQGSAFVVGGGGGGYSGGGSGGHVTPGGGVGGGGASFNAGVCPSGTTGLSTGHGSVIISYGTSTVAPVLSSGLPSGSSFPVGTTVVTYTAADGAGNTATCSFSVTVKDVTSPTITCPSNINQCTSIVNGIGPTSINDNCPTPAITYSFSGATSGTGVNNASGSSFNPGTTNVTYIATDVSGNTGSCTFSVTTGIAPNLTITASSLSVCPSNTVSLTASGANTYTWSGGITNSIPFSPASTTVYTVTGTSAGGCTSTATQTITLNPLPIINITNPTSCVGGTINFSASGGGTYLWSGPNSFTSNIQNPQINNAQTTMNGAYSVTVTTALGCSSVAISNVSVSAIPAPAIGSNTPCLGATLNLTTSVANSYTWSGPSAFNSNLQNPNILNVTAANAGIYTLTVINASGCLGTTTISVGFNSLPTPIATSNGTYCVGQTITLNGSGGVSANWSGPSGYSSTSFTSSILSASIANNGVYTLVVTGANSCTNSTTTNILINTLPIITVNNPTACVNGNLVFNATGGVSYNWQGPLSFNNATQNPTISLVSLSNAGTYSVIVTGANSCTNIATSNALVYSLPLVSTSNLSVCIGGSITLNSSGANTYTWNGPNLFTSNNQNPIIPNASTLNMGAYTVTGASAQGCINTSVSNVSVGLSVLPSISSNTPCVGTNLNLSTGAAISYTWSGPSGFNSSLQNPVVNNSNIINAGTYSITSISAAGCIASNTLAVTINTLPLISSTPNTTVCALSAINFTASGGNSIVWIGPGGFNSTSYSPSISSASLANAGNYTLTASNLTGCSSSTIISVTVNNLPIVTINNPTICTNGNLVFNANGGNNYSWQGPLAFNSAIQNPTITNATIGNSGSYTVTATALNGCTNTAISNATVFSLPSISVSNSGQACVNGSVSLNANGGLTYSWSGPAGYASIIQNPVINNLNLTNNGSYSVIVTNANTCTNTAITNVTINPLPLVNIGVNSPICVGQTLNFIGSSTNNNQWLGPNNFTSIQSNPSISNVSLSHNGTYSLTVTDINGCKSTTTAIVNINPLPQIIATGATVCEGQTINLNASGGSTYVWNGPNGYTSNLQNPSIPNALVSLAGIYQVQVTSSAGCTASTSVNVSINSAPTGTTSSNSPICEKNKLNLFSSSANSYLWQGPNGFTSVNQNPEIQNINTLATGNYTLTIFDAIGCYTNIITSVIINPLPNITLNASKREACVPECIIFNAVSNATGTNVIYSWNLDRSETSNINGTTATGCYNTIGDFRPTVFVLDGNGCSNTATVLVTMNPLPTPDFIYEPNKPTYFNNNVEFNYLKNSDNIATYEWQNNTTTFALTQNPTYKFDEIGEYTITLNVTTNKGCKGNVTKVIKIEDEFALFIPNAFTPNNDGMNDIFKPKGTNVKNYTLLIFDRWGELIFKTNDLDKGWDGTFKGKECQNGVYTFKASATMEGGKAKEFLGSVTLQK
ncbi:MAG: HYR domain-containing protein [Bacteroidia bacterium]